MSQYHIKRYGGFMCGKHARRLYRWDSSIKLKEAHVSDLKLCCPECIVKYYQYCDKNLVVIKE